MRLLDPALGYGYTVWGTKRGAQIFHVENVKGGIDAIKDDLEDIRALVSVATPEQEFYSVEENRNYYFFTAYKSIKDWANYGRSHGRIGFFAITLIIPSNKRANPADIYDKLKIAINFFWENQILRDAGVDSYRIAKEKPIDYDQFHPIFKGLKFKSNSRTFWPHGKKGKVYVPPTKSHRTHRYKEGLTKILDDFFKGKYQRFNFLLLLPEEDQGKYILSLPEAEPQSPRSEDSQIQQSSEQTISKPQQESHQTKEPYKVRKLVTPPSTSPETDTEIPKKQIKVVSAAKPTSEEPLSKPAAKKIRKKWPQVKYKLRKVGIVTILIALVFLGWSPLSGLLGLMFSTTLEEEYVSKFNDAYADLAETLFSPSERTLANLAEISASMNQLNVYDSLLHSQELETYWTTDTLQSAKDAYHKYLLSCFDTLANSKDFEVKYANELGAELKRLGLDKNHTIKTYIRARMFYFGAMDIIGTDLKSLEGDSIRLNCMGMLFRILSSDQFGKDVSNRLPKLKQEMNKVRIGLRESMESNHVGFDINLLELEVETLIDLVKNNCLDNGQTP